MINFHKPTTAGFTAGILLIGVLGLSAPASAGPGGGHGPGRPPPPVFLEGSQAGRAVGTTCSISNRPIASTSGKTVGYRRVQVCN
jgi:hypothetical protein